MMKVTFAFWNNGCIRTELKIDMMTAGNFACGENKDINMKLVSLFSIFFFKDLRNWADTMNKSIAPYISPSLAFLPLIFF